MSASDVPKKQKLKHVLSTLTASMMFMVAATETPLSATPCVDQNNFSLAYFGFISLNHLTMLI